MELESEPADFIVMRNVLEHFDDHVAAVNTLQCLPKPCVVAV